jgi:hypothetical protein
MRVVASLLVAHRRCNHIVISLRILRRSHDVNRVRRPRGGPEAKEIVMTAGERLIQQGIQRGIQEGIHQGIHQGIKEGIQQGERALLLRLLRKRFGTQVDADTERRVEAASAEQIAAWAEGLLSATTLADLLAS